MYLSQQMAQVGGVVGHIHLAHNLYYVKYGRCRWLATRPCCAYDARDPVMQEARP